MTAIVAEEDSLVTLDAAGGNRWGRIGEAELGDIARLFGHAAQHERIGGWAIELTIVPAVVGPCAELQ
jgi:hypothetical protein